MVSATKGYRMHRIVDRVGRPDESTNKTREIQGEKEPIGQIFILDRFMY